MRSYFLMKAKLVAAFLLQVQASAVEAFQIGTPTADRPSLQFGHIALRLHDGAQLKSIP